MNRHVKYILIALTTLLAQTILMAKQNASIVSMNGELRICDVSTTKQLYVDYIYGTVELVFWNKDEILLKYEESVKASSKKQAEDMLQKRHVIKKENSEGYVLKVDKPWYSTNNSCYDSKWTVYVPAKLRKVHVKNEFGWTNVGEGYQGQLRLDSNHGSINATDIRCITQMSLSYSNFYIGYCNSLELKSEYSNGNIGYGVKIDLSCDHTEAIKIDKVKRLSISSKHSKYQIAKVDEVNLYGSFLNVDFFEVQETMHIGAINHSTISIKDLKGRYNATNLTHSKLHVAINKSHRTPSILINGSSYTDICVSIPKGLKTSCMLVNKYGKIDIAVASSVKQRILEKEEKNFTSRLYTLFNTSTYTPNSNIDIQNRHGKIEINSY